MSKEVAEEVERNRMSKEVAEEVCGWLRVFSDGTVERRWSGEEEHVSALTVRVPPSGDTFVEGVATRDVVVNNATGVWVRIYLPQQLPRENQRLAVVVHLHGGVFCTSHADWQMYYQFYSRLVKLSNVICVSVDFRLAPEHRLPAACDDSFGALLWLRSVARREIEEPWLSRYADFGRCVLMGDGTGGNLVHDVARRALATPAADLLRPVRVRGGVSIHPGYVRPERSKSEMEIQPDSALLSQEMVDKFFKLSAPEGIVATRDHPITNPMGPHAPPLKELMFPRMLVAIADRDIISDTQLEYCNAMKSAGHDVVQYISQKVGHCFHLNETAIKYDPNTAEETSKLLHAVDRFIKSCF